MSKAPEQIWMQSDHIPSHVALDRIDVQPDADEAHQFTSYTRTDYAQATHCAAIGYIAEQLARRGADVELVNAVLATTPTDAKAALERIVQDAVKEALDRAENG